MPSPSSATPSLENTSERQAALRRYHILDTAPEKDFDRITSLVAKVCDASTALITLIDEERQWFKSCFNFDARETGISVSFCVHAVHNGEMLVVEDATEDPRFKDNPIVTGPPYIRFYAGAPLTTPEGIHIGSLCIIDYEPKTFDAAQREILERMADVVVNQFELRSAEAQVRQLIDENPQPMYVYAQSDGHIMKANAAAVSQYGYEAQDFAGLTANDLQAPASYRDPGSVLALHQRADGSFFPARVREREVLVDGRAAVLATVQPTPLHSSDSTFMVIDRDGIIRSVSHDNTADGPLCDVVGTAFESLSNPFDQGRISNAMNALMKDERDVINQEVMIDTAGGSHPYEAHLRPLRSERGSVVGVSAVLVPPGASTSSPKPSPALVEDEVRVEEVSAPPTDADRGAPEQEIESDSDKAAPVENQGDAEDTPPAADTASEPAETAPETADEAPASAPDTEAVPGSEEQVNEEPHKEANDAPAEHVEDGESDNASVFDGAPGDGTADAAPTATPESFSDTAASSLLRSLRAREQTTDERSAPHTTEED
ncbi:hypothetical protein CRI93_02370 [Longimonas halophila]|uniref:PAS domain-containing protein n=1 Tax=Longimonas halophila TaxID=1469170 RepID=A0A2H3P9J2_9BACT|nr:PAS domain-containing protein [Longimonas halophila]PEN09595.1 hypothetical protein CRI93_02370 [Longimonas halophila]